MARHGPHISIGAWTPDEKTWTWVLFVHVPWTRIDGMRSTRTYRHKRSAIRAARRVAKTLGIAHLEDR